ncbi:SIMPL domain-containing protein [Pseudaestuariivita atlantica]|uniref:Periplasmic immunogenic protein n=1 Tax=Pseudaestuariivita atlantica TaxID=1317121 RepID=A0A0L1JQH7_9RHOB|nr:SIMPL domain-containing protein [Pseudaestuariivita atlantica]KNG93985.1 hypothetical protein ATO11_06880 [Pseudaestuariivita atlantica]
MIRVLLAACAFCVLGVAAMAEGATLTVSGEGQVAAAPDMAVIRLSVAEEDVSAKVAMREVAAAAAQVLARLDAFDIADKDRQTSQLTLDPIWEGRGSSLKAPRVARYAARTEVVVRVRDLDVLGQLLDAVLEDGANGFGGLQFSVADPQPLEDAARKAAVADAMRTAKLLAEAAGVTLGPVMNMSLNGGGRPSPVMARMEMASDAGIPVAAGEVGYSATVTMVFDISE